MNGCHIFINPFTAFRRTRIWYCASESSTFSMSSSQICSKQIKKQARVDRQCVCHSCHRATRRAFGVVVRDLEWWETLFTWPLVIKVGHGPLSRLFQNLRPQIRSNPTYTALSYPASHSHDYLHKALLYKNHFQFTSARFWDITRHLKKKKERKQIVTASLLDWNESYRKDGNFGIWITRFSFTGTPGIFATLCVSIPTKPECSIRISDAVIFTFFAIWQTTNSYITTVC